MIDCCKPVRGARKDKREREDFQCKWVCIACQLCVHVSYCESRIQDVPVQQQWVLDGKKRILTVYYWINFCRVVRWWHHFPYAQEMSIYMYFSLSLHLYFIFHFITSARCFVLSSRSLTHFCIHLSMHTCINCQDWLSDREKKKWKLEKKEKKKNRKLAYRWARARDKREKE